MSSSNPWSGLVLMWRKCTFNRIMIPSTPPNWPRNGLKTKDSRFIYGPLNHQTSTQLNTCGITSREGSMSMKFLQRVFMSYGIEWRRSGKLYPKMWCRIWGLYGAPCCPVGHDRTTMSPESIFFWWISALFSSHCPVVILVIFQPDNLSTGLSDQTVQWTWPDNDWNCHYYCY